MFIPEEMPQQKNAVLACAQSHALIDVNYLSFVVSHMVQLPHFGTTLVVHCDCVLGALRCAWNPGEEQRHLPRRHLVYPQRQQVRLAVPSLFKTTVVMCPCDCPRPLLK